MLGFRYPVQSVRYKDHRIFALEGLAVSFSFVREQELKSKGCDLYKLMLLCNALNE